MSSSLLRRRSATALSIWVSVAFGILGTVVAARALGLEAFGVFATTLAVVGFFQTLADLTVEESLTKFGFRYVAAREWGRLRRLFRSLLLLKVAGGALATLVLALLAPLGDEVFGASGVTTAILAGALLPLVQSVENVGATAFLLHSRYDLRGAYQAGSAGLRLVAIAVGAHLGVVEALLGIVVAQLLASAVVSAAGVVALRRFPAAPQEKLGADVPAIRSFVLQSSVATGVVSLRGTLVPILLGVVAGPTEVGLFRIAQAPLQGLTAASSPARLVLLTEQTRDWEQGLRGRVLAGLRSYTRWAGALMLVAVPVFFVAMPWLVRVVFGAEYEGAVTAARVVLLAAAVHFTLGWTKSFPVTIGRPRLRILTHGIEAAVALPLVLALGTTWGATGAAVAILVATLAFAATWGALLLRLRAELRPGSAAGRSEQAAAS
ncbi:MAG: lipopolysaccharide biosynthesis protein [Thermoleophilia bacterium]|nr:lipopolysaccharide biosynthesis protein [Thermoleophilia bacterium]